MAEEELDTNVTVITDEQEAPWFVLFNGGREERDLTFYSVEGKRSYTKIIPQLAERCCSLTMSSHGWFLILNRADIEFSLVNPTSMEIVQNIPRPPQFPPPLENALLPLPMLLMLRQVVSYNITAPPTDENCVLLITLRDYPYVMVYSLREKKWSVKKVHMSERDDAIQSIIVVDDEIILGLTRNNHFIRLNNLECDEPTIEYLNKIPDDPLRGKTNYLCMVKSHGELYMVLAVELLRTGVVEKLSVLKLNLSEMQWDEVNDIGDYVFFLDFFTCEGISCRADDACLKRNHIYYVKNKDLCRYNVVTMAITTLRSFPQLTSYYWVLAKLTNMDEQMKCLDLESDKKTERYALSLKGCGSNDALVPSTQLLRGDIRKKAEVVNVRASESEETQLKRLFPEIVPGILSHLSYFDSRSLGRAFPNWLPIVRQTLKLINYMVPPFFVAFTSNYKSCCFIDPLRGVRHVIQSPELPCNVKILSSKHGWLLLMTTRHDLTETDSWSTDIFFYNPISKAIIRLPPYDFHDKTFSFSSPPTSSNCVVIAERVSNYKGKMVICRKGDSRWTKIGGKFQQNLERFETLYTPPVFLKEKFHFLSRDGRVGMFNPVTRSWEVHGQRKITMYGTHRHYLVISNNELFWVWAEEKVGQVFVYKLDNSNYEWKETQSLEGNSFFLWRNSFDRIMFVKRKERESLFPDVAR